MDWKHITKTGNFYCRDVHIGKFRPFASPQGGGEYEWNIGQYHLGENYEKAGEKERK